MSQFVHLHLHSEYSVVDSTLKVKPAIALAKASGQPAIAFTDEMNMFALIKFYNAAIQEGIKPVIGADCLIESADGSVFKVTCLCQNNQGYLNLSRLISRAYLQNQKLVQNAMKALIQQDWLAELNEGLIVLSGGMAGDIGQALLAEKLNLAAKRTSWWMTYFPDRFYLELVRNGRSQDAVYIAAAVDLAHRYELPVVATNDVRFEKTTDFEAHEVRVCIHDGTILEDPNRPKRYTEEQYFRTTDEMVALFEEFPEAIENTVEIAKRCNVTLTLGTYFLPDFPVPEGHTIESYFIEASHKGLEERLQFLYGHLTPEAFAQTRQPYDERLKFELDIIIQMGFPGYFFIVADFIQWGKNHQVPVGPGRGSGAGSLVAYVLKITDLDPLQYDLLFERFLNPERVSMPDFDVDFCMERRDLVIDYVSKQYGQDHVSQIVTFGTMAAKAVVRDVGRVLGYGYGMVDAIAKLIPNDLGIKLAGALEQEAQLQEKYDEDEDVKLLLDLAQQLEGTVRNTGKHAGGVVIGPKPLDHFCPLLCEPDGSSVVTQLDKNDVETAGLVKFDFLGLRTLTIIDWALQFINEGKQKGDEGFIEIERIPLDDERTFDLIKTGKTTGVFQLESSGMQNLIVRLRPDCFEDIIALVALFRPGPLESGMVDNFIARKHGKEKVSYPDAQYQHDSLKEILEPTYGVILYQEQVMQIAQVLAGYTLGGADMLRRAMGKKKPEEMAKQRSIFKEGAINNHVDGDLAMKIFDLVEKFAGYGFNKSHSAAYALVSYQSAWLKTHFPAEFMAAQISSDMDTTDKVVHMVNECHAMGIGVAKPSINEGEIHFKAIRGERKVRYGLGAIKGVGESALHGIIEERNQHGHYQDLFDFCLRVTRKVNKRVIEALIVAGAMDCLHDNRNAMLHTVGLALQKAEQQHKNEEAGQADLFGDVSTFVEENRAELVAVPELSEKQRLKAEKDVLGLYMTGHPIEIYRQELDKMVDQKLSALRPEKWQKKWVAGLIVEARSKVTKSGNRMGFLAIDDRTARLDVVLRAAVFESSRDLLVPDSVVLVYGEVAEDTFNGGIKFDAEQLVSLAEARIEKARAIKLYSDQSISIEQIHAVATVLSAYRAEQGLPLVVDYQNSQAKVQLKSEANNVFVPDDELLEALRAEGWQLEVVY
ncbi:MAG: DNA polymerase III subunit alpha [Piscirickettsiaceae bacterium CG_4_9_14_3_um_filter_43_564]|nr:DNA polymerase III subunit alpha [Thiomicrospira sp.]OIP96949.1 MAG: DNA polymerase III subunit alpha [Thiomicrospira sp. CG2_30_44_34]PIQ02612.1 MAG: DNA polymerase III subunit alpha [Piscirickettsiaceae bacterium CG18_big_fil_WC_8_21_14_2_50_44_103]PIU39543.1 MAG: DNA polymerase III subunit alpha [Piscirickettsiaceae bacterium CG07_land_8_20_14_0_80_44_28]PIW57393.1 MAG: DNA polymerase III subunit alpha [Piscirickettsiaceae bacterium CG12_big_fil_rev_8_21_14_0_65_44_934]PIW78038.1 MAG: DN